MAGRLTYLDGMGLPSPLPSTHTPSKNPSRLGRFTSLNGGERPHRSEFGCDLKRRKEFSTYNSIILLLRDVDAITRRSFRRLDHCPVLPRFF